MKQSNTLLAIPIILIAMMIIGYGQTKQKSDDDIFNAIQNDDASKVSELWKTENATPQYEWEILSKAVLHGSHEVIRTLSDWGVDLNQKGGESGETVLANAVLNGSVATIEVLLNSGADANTQDDLGQSPMLKTILYRAEDETEQANIVRLLITHGGDSVLADYEGQTAFNLAKSLNYPEALGAMIEQ
jgi:uncharacterized protein